MQLNGFIGGAYTLQDKVIEAQRCVNLYPQLDESQTGKNVAALLSVPGTKLFNYIGTGPIRNLFTTSRGRVFVVSGAEVMEFNADGSTANRGTVSPGNFPVGIAENGQQMMIVDGAKGYQLDLTTNSYTDAVTFQGGQQVVFIDGYFLYNKPSTQQFYITGQYNTTTDPLDFASKEGWPDLIVTILSDHRELWIFGQQTIEVWFNSGDPTFPFQRISGGFITKGTVGPYTPTKLDNTIYWIGQDESGNGIAWKANGYTPVRVSTHAIEQQWRKYATIADAVSYSYELDGHSFWVINFPTGNATWVYDAATQLWHERAFTLPTGFLGRQRYQTHCYGFGNHLVGDAFSNAVYVLDPNTYTDLKANDYGTVPLTRLRSSPYIAKELRGITISRLQLDMKVGLGPDSDSSILPPQVTLCWSDDNANTWSNEYPQSLGRIGEFLTRVVWRRLGRTRQRIFEVKVSDAVPVTIVDALIEAEVSGS